MAASVQRRRYFFNLVIASVLLVAQTASAISISRCLRGLRLLFEPGATRVDALWSTGLDPTLAARLARGERVSSKELTEALRTATALDRVVQYLRAEEAFNRAWAAVKKNSATLLKAFRERGAAGQHERLAWEIREILHKKYGVQKIAFHHNMHGGMAIDFAAEGGIRATPGDAYSSTDFFEINGIAVSRATPPEAQRPATVFYYPEVHGVDGVLSSLIPNAMHETVPHVLTVFDLEATLARPGVKPYRNEIAEGIEVPKGTKIGVPYEDFAIIPLPVMTNVNELAGVSERLTQAERVFLNLIALRQLLREADLPTLKPRP